MTVESNTYLGVPHVQYLYVGQLTNIFFLLKIPKDLTYLKLCILEEASFKQIEMYKTKLFITQSKIQSSGA